MDPFETLGIEPSFALEAAELASRQRELSSALHPDRYVGRPSGEKRAALNRAIEVNEAFRALKAPISRAESLIAILGLTLPEAEQPPASPALLMEMMESREELRDAGKKGDEARIESLVSSFKKEEARVLSDLSAAFDAAQQAKARGESPDAAELYRAVATLRYLRRFFDEAEALLDELL